MTNHLHNCQQAWVRPRQVLFDEDLSDTRTQIKSPFRPLKTTAKSLSAFGDIPIPKH